MIKDGILYHYVQVAIKELIILKFLIHGLYLCLVIYNNLF